MEHPMKPLSEQLADMSVRAKSAEDAMAAAQKEAHDKLVARKEQAHAAATNAVEKVDQKIKSVADSSSQHWNAMKAKITADINTLKTRVATQKHEHDVKRAGKHADQLESEAGFAIDYAIASIEQAKLAVLDAVGARLDAEKLRAA
jgi:exonuclease VII large subunit